MKNTFLLLLLSTVLPLGLCADAAPRPNILYVYVDDMGWGSIGPNGQTLRAANGQAHVLTPTINKLAEEGVNFTRAYGCTVCSPARSSQQSGFHQGHTFGDRNSTDNARKAMRAEDKLMGDVLSAAGYVTGYWGKWGYGASSDQVSPVIQNIQTLPTSHGYGYALVELHHVRAHTFFQPTLWSAPAAPGAIGGLELIPNSMAAYANNPAYPEQPAKQSHAAYPATAYCDDSYAFAALDFIRAQGQNYNATGQPFFGLLAVQVPHSPYDEINQLPSWDDAYSSDTNFPSLSAQAQQWAAMCTRIDSHCANLLAALEDPNNDGSTDDSIASNTLVVFQSDNGGPGNAGRTELDANGGLRGTKGSIWEGGIRVPLAVRWPAMITGSSVLQKGTSSDLVIDVTDLLPTFCELAGVEPPLGVDGVSLASTLTGAGHQRTRDFLIHEAGSANSIIRGKYKLVGPGNALYDLDADPDESDDISGSNTALVAELSDLLLGEHVGEPYGFANTYHQWTGTNNANTSDPDNWSDYIYANAGITYMTETGAPGATYPWIALMEHTGAQPATAVADADLKFLGLEIRGASAGATQTLNVNSQSLTGRNEIRLAPHSALLLDNGSVNSVRWVDVQANASFSGAGLVDATLYNAGHVAITAASSNTVPGPDITIPGPDITLTNGQEYVSNGGFENGTDTGNGDYSYDTLVDWFTTGTPSSNDGAKPNNAYAPIMRGLINTGFPLIQTTDFPFVLGDSYTLTFWGRGFSGWSSGELTRIQVFYDAPGGSSTDLLTTTLALINGAWNEATYNIPAITDTNAVGKAVQVLLGPDTGTGFASFDEVSLIRHGPDITVPGPDITMPGPDITVPGHRKLEVSGNYHEFDGATLDLTLAGTMEPGTNYAQLLVNGDATLAGALSVTVDPGYTPAHGDRFTVLTANSISGSFTNAENVAVAGDGTRFLINYSDTTVILIVDAVTAQGTPYSWLEFYNIDGGDHESADLIDHDGNGMLAWEEYVAGTIPTNMNSTLTVSVEPSISDDTLAIRWPSVAGRIYHLLHSVALTDPFSLYAGPFGATPPDNSLTVPLDTSDLQFFRVSVERE